MTSYPDEERNRARAESILSVAQELLLSWGYKRITIDDIARRARVGKGTIYLHWKTKEALFTDLLRREMGATFGEMSCALREEPSMALLHRMLHSLFVLHTTRPLAKAIFGADTDILGALAPDKTAPSLARAFGLFDFLTQVLQVLRDHGLLRADHSLEDQAHSVDAILVGFFMLAELPSHPSPALARQADLLSDTVRAAFGTRGPPDNAAVEMAAQKIRELIAEMQAGFLGGENSLATRENPR